MTLRTAGLIAGVLGLILLAVGAVANWVKPAAEASPSAAIDVAVVVIPPEVLAISPDAVLTVSGDGTLAAHTARSEDVVAWTETRDSVTLTGIADWDTLSFSTDPATEPVASPSPSASASPSASGSSKPSPTASPKSSPSASASPDSSASPGATASATPNAEPTPLGSQDIWRNTAQQTESYSINAIDVPVGLTLVVEALDGATVQSAALTLPRVVDDEWIGQLLWWGIVLSVLGLIALIALFVDVRPAQSKSEEWLARRTAIGTGKEDPKPGGRRHRRQAGATMPVAVIPTEPTTGAIPVVEAPPTTAGVYVVPVTGSPSEQLTPSAPAQDPAQEPASEPPVEPSPQDFAPPSTDDGEDRS